MKKIFREISYTCISRARSCKVKDVRSIITQRVVDVKLGKKRKKNTHVLVKFIKLYLNNFNSMSWVFFCKDL